MPKAVKIKLPIMIKEVTMMNARRVETFATFFFSESLKVSVNPRKIGALAMGFIMAKKPVNTLIEKVKSSCDIMREILINDRKLIIGEQK